MQFRWSNEQNSPNTNSNVIGEIQLCMQVKLYFLEVSIKCLCLESMGYIMYIILSISMQPSCVDMSLSLDNGNDSIGRVKRLRQDT